MLGNSVNFVDYTYVFILKKGSQTCPNVSNSNMSKSDVERNRCLQIQNLEIPFRPMEY